MFWHGRIIVLSLYCSQVCTSLLALLYVSLEPCSSSIMRDALLMTYILTIPIDVKSRGASKSVLSASLFNSIKNPPAVPPWMYCRAISTQHYKPKSDLIKAIQLLMLAVSRPFPLLILYIGFPDVFIISALIFKV